MPPPTGQAATCLGIIRVAALRKTVKTSNKTEKTKPNRKTSPLRCGRARKSRSAFPSVLGSFRLNEAGLRQKAEEGGKQAARQGHRPGLGGRGNGHSNTEFWKHLASGLPLPSRPQCPGPSVPLVGHFTALCLSFPTCSGGVPPGLQTLLLPKIAQERARPHKGSVQRRPAVGRVRSCQQKRCLPALSGHWVVPGCGGGPEAADPHRGCAARRPSLEFQGPATVTKHLREALGPGLWPLKAETTEPRESSTGDVARPCPLRGGPCPDGPLPEARGPLLPLRPVFLALPTGEERATGEE